MKLANKEALDVVVAAIQSKSIELSGPGSSVSVSVLRANLDAVYLLNLMDRLTGSTPLDSE
jgi:hypothetical protein